jgi:hypothetical protein
MIFYSFVDEMIFQIPFRWIQKLKSFWKFTLKSNKIICKNHQFNYTLY